MEMGNKWAAWADEASGHSLTLRLMYNKCHMIKHEEQDTRTKLEDVIRQ